MARSLSSTILPIVGIAALVGAGVGMAWPDPAPGVAAPTPSPAYTLTELCQEDDPCWDCAEMGNHICGGTELTDADRAAGWDAWDKSAGWTRLPATSTEVKVSFVGVAPTQYPKLGNGEITVVGTDSKWYVFTSDTVVTE